LIASGKCHDLYKVKRKVVQNKTILVSVISRSVYVIISSIAAGIRIKIWYGVAPWLQL